MQFQTMYQILKYKKHLLVTHMRSIEFLVHAIVFLLIKGVDAREAYKEQDFEIEMITGSERVADPESPYNPVRLEAERNRLSMLSALIAFGTPNFVGTVPPGVIQFMTSEILASAKSGEKQFSFARGLGHKLVSKKRKIRLDDKCSKKQGSNSCKPGYVKVRYDRSADDCYEGGKSSSAKKQRTDSISVTTQSSNAKTVTTSTTSSKAVQAGKLTSTESADEPSNDQNKN